MIGFLLTVLTAVVLLAAGFLLGLFWLREEHARLTVLRGEIEQRVPAHAAVGSRPRCRRHVARWGAADWPPPPVAK